MNTRLQVEHGVTELVTGLDLVAWQIRVAAGEPLPDEVVDAPRHGHAIEVRLYAENPYDGFRPTAGRVTAWQMPAGPGVRVDAGIEADTDLRPEYDPLLAKLMVHAEDRPSAIDRLRRALDETVIGGVQTDAGFLRWLVDDEAFVGGDYDTGLIEERWGLDHRIGREDAAMAATARAGGPPGIASQHAPDRRWLPTTGRPGAGSRAARHGGDERLRGARRGRARRRRPTAGGSSSTTGDRGIARLSTAPRPRPSWSRVRAATGSSRSAAAGSR